MLKNSHIVLLSSIVHKHFSLLGQVVQVNLCVALNASHSRTHESGLAHVLFVQSVFLLRRLIVDLYRVLFALARTQVPRTTSVWHVEGPTIAD